MRMKTTCLTFLVLLLILSGSADALSQPTLSIGQSSASALQRVQVPVTLVTRSASLATLRMDISYDESLLSDPVVTVGPAGAGKTLLTSALRPGAVRISLFDLLNAPMADGTIVTLAFTLTSSAPGGTSVGLAFDATTVGASDPAGNDIPIACSDGAISIP